MGFNSFGTPLQKVQLVRVYTMLAEYCGSTLAALGFVPGLAHTTCACFFAALVFGALRRFAARQCGSRIVVYAAILYALVYTRELVLYAAATRSYVRVLAVLCGAVFSTC